MSKQPVSKVRDIALGYLKRGWQCIPVPWKSKGPVIKDWQNLRITIALLSTYFSDKLSNIGVLLGAPSNDLTDVDIDCLEALALAPHFLPPTGAIFGRPGKPSSHWLYITSGIQSKQFTSPEGMIVEIRSTGLQTVFPGSVHETGERIEWETEGEPAHVSAEALTQAVARLAAAVGLVRSWPLEGARHHAALALSGALLKAGWEESDAKRFVEIVATYGGSNKIAAKVKTVATTRKRLDADRPVTGLTALKEVMPVAVVVKIAEWLSLRIDNASASQNPLCTDAANGDRLVRAYGSDILWVEEAKTWYTYDGKQWKRDSAHRLQEMAVAVARAIGHEAAQATTAKAKNELEKWGIISQSKSGIEAMIALARHQVARPYEIFDADPWLLNVKNGTVNLKTGELQPHRREDFITKLVPIPYDVGQACPQWECFLDEISGHDPALVRYLQMAVGYSLTGETSEQCFFLIVGSGSNGKSVFLEVLQLLLGEYARAIESRALVHKRSITEAVRNDLAALRGARLAFAAEIRPDAQLDEQLVKSLTGNDKITARFLFQEFFEFYALFKIWWVVNDLPRIRDTSDAMWRRVRLIPFSVTIPSSRQVRNLARTLIAEEGPGILAWAVKGCLAWQRESLTPPQVVRDAITAYRQKNDPIGEFLAVHCVSGASIGARAVQSYTSFTDLYRAYERWWKDNGDGQAPLSPTAFGVNMRERGYVPVQKWYAEEKKNRKVYMGIELLRGTSVRKDASGELDFSDE